MAAIVSQRPFLIRFLKLWKESDLCWTYSGASENLRNFLILTVLLFVHDLYRFLYTDHTQYLSL